MNAVLWVVVAVFAPSLIGFIIYLLVRGSYSDLRCGRCNTAIKDYYVVCPKCGAKLKPSCPNCSEPVKSDWIVCPKCSQPLPEYQNDIVEAQQARDGALWKILLFIIVIPILFIIIASVVFSAYTASGGAVGSSEIPVEVYLQEGEQTEIEEWFSMCDASSEKAYVLEYREEYGKQKQINYLIYIPQMADRYNFIPNQKNGLFRDTMQIEFENVSDEPGDTFQLVTCVMDSYPELEILLDGVALECEITEVDFDLDPNDYME